jgi:hypothetical protein
MVRVKKALPGTGDGRNQAGPINHGRPFSNGEYPGKDITGHDDNKQYYPPDNEAPQPADHYRGQANAGHLYPSQDSLRIRWPVFAELHDIMVIDDPLDASSPAKPFQASDGRFHQAAYSAVTNPPCSSLEVGVDCLGQYAEETFGYCECEFADEEGAEGACTCEGVYHEPNPIHVTGKGKEGAVTIEDVILTLSPYLRSLKDDILRAKSYHLDPPLPPETQFYAGPMIYASRFRVFQDKGESNQINWELAAQIASKLHNTPRELRK